MKKFIAIILSFMTALTMSSCSKKINNEFFSEETLKSYALSSDFPAPNVKTASLMSDANLYVSLDADEYESYAESVCEYLNENDYYYVGTYKQQGLIGEMVPRYVYETLDSNYDFSSKKHNFTYSPTDDLSSMSDGYCKINMCFVITVERVEDTKYSAFASETYNTIIRLGGNNSIYVSDDQREEHRLNIKDLNNIILNKDELCKPNESYGLYKAEEEITFSIQFFSGISATLNIDGVEYAPEYDEAWKPGHISYVMPDHGVSVISLVNGFEGDEAKLCESVEWGGCITGETLDYVDIQEWFIGVDPEYEYGKTARTYNEDYAISSWFNTAYIREQKYDIDGGSGYVITFTLKDGSIYVLSVSNDYIGINGKNYYIIGGIPYFLTKSFM